VGKLQLAFHCEESAKIFFFKGKEEEEEKRSNWKISCPVNQWRKH
jgi:hypothetical protein